MTREERYLELVSDELKVSIEEILGDCRDRKIIEARQIACYVLKTFNGMTHQQIADFLHYDEQSSISYSISQVKTLLSNNEIFRSKAVPVLRKSKLLRKEFNIATSDPLMNGSEFFDFYSETAFEQTAQGISEFETKELAA